MKHGSLSLLVFCLAMRGSQVVENAAIIFICYHKVRAPKLIFVSKGCPNLLDLGFRADRLYKAASVLLPISLHRHVTSDVCNDSGPTEELRHLLAIERLLTGDSQATRYCERHA